MRHGRHWPREEQLANAREGAFPLPGNDAEAARVHAAWAALLTTYDDGDVYFPDTRALRRGHG